MSTQQKSKTNQNKENKPAKYPEEYIRYIASGESAAVFIVRDIVNSINTTKKWIDVISSSCYDKCGERAFNWILVELFPRKQEPKFTKDMDADYRKYVTWLTAHEDINRHRRSGYIGEKYLVLCNLYNANKGKTYIDTTVMTKPNDAPESEYHPLERPYPPEWHFRIQKVKRVEEYEASYICQYEENILQAIREEGRPLLKHFGLSEEPKPKYPRKKNPDKRVKAEKKPAGNNAEKTKKQNKQKPSPKGKNGSKGKK